MKYQTLDLFPAPAEDRHESLAEGAVVLHQFSLPWLADLWAELPKIEAVAPFRRLETPGGFRMSVAMTNCGDWGWVSDRRGYRYEDRDPVSGKAWPAMPGAFVALADAAARAAGFTAFVPDACLINRYAPGARLTLHRDQDELDLGAPVVSVSLGLPATFLWGGVTRSERQRRVPLRHGDIVVWGGPSRLHYHGVLPIKEGVHEVIGAQRINLTFRRAR